MNTPNSSQPVTQSVGGAAKQTARYLTLEFGGYFMCRLATDPDPSDDPYGTSGYTMALSNEPVLDQVIRLQYDPVAAPLRKNPLPHIQVGVTVQSVSFDGAVDEQRSAALKGARVNLLGNPKFISNNNTVGSDDTMAFVVEPFHLRISHDAPCQGHIVPVTIEATDNLIPGHPEIQAVQIPNPAVYARRFSSFASAPSATANQAIGVYDEYGYFRDRRRWLAEQMEKTTDPQEKQAFKSRIYQIEEWGDRVINKLGFQANWAHDTNGPQLFTADPKLLGGLPVVDQPWTVNYWFGGWDGDLLVGYMGGALNIPFVPN
jgi:hypothetical protein